MFFRFDPAQVPEILHSFEGDLQLSRRFVETAQAMDAFRAIAPYDGDVLIVHGTADRTEKTTVRHFVARSFFFRALWPVISSP